MMMSSTSSAINASSSKVDPHLYQVPSQSEETHKEEESQGSPDLQWKEPGFESASSTRNYTNPSNFSAK